VLVDDQRRASAELNFSVFGQEMQAAIIVQE
jgi:hypothetical protein